MLDNEVEDMVEYTFTVVEIDLDYEFDAPRYFNFCGGESPVEARAAESWFETAGTYPPSPFVKKLVSSEGNCCGNISAYAKPKDADSMSLSESDSDTEDVYEKRSSRQVCSTAGDRTGIAPMLASTTVLKFQNLPEVLPTGLTFYNHLLKDNSKAKNKYGRKPSYPRSSTLMKPTASHLAKQNPSHLVGGVRFPNSVRDIAEPKAIVSDNQASKRQKLEGGLLHKVTDTKAQTNFIHKAPKRGMTTERSRKFPIPNFPDKPQKETENATSDVYRFKARPLNRKMFETTSLIPKRSTPQPPQFQEFNLKTSERAMQHKSATSSNVVSNNTNKEFHLKTSERAMQHKSATSFNVVSNNTNKVLQNSNTGFSFECENKERRKPNITEQVKQEGSLSSNKLKALPLNKKILLSRGELGVFRNIKKETTVPMEFNFLTEKRGVHHNHSNPPIELFNKLSLACGTQSSAEAPSRLKQPAFITSKVSLIPYRLRVSFHGGFWRGF
ncbi:unnamed protein product [Cuscuta europaea]|uniref:TPX2 central domain-containing protein n=1 Tax=Cuscuta europaea TaxID=41803 RepID=A0A9P0Z4U2_CUSEU|nr:unnamed protein product [Cuscuta europaea]